MMKMMRMILILLAAVLMASVGMADKIKYARYPALSPDGQTIAFTYMGDIWTVASSGGTASRVTVHPAEDVRPHFSPDGTKIMFSSARFNNYDVFTIPVEGGIPERLTLASSTDMGTAWFANGDSVLFTSRREGWGDIYKISADGGMPIKLTGYMREKEHFCRMSSDGKYLLFNTGSGDTRWWRRDLRSSRNADIYLLDRSQKEFTSQRLTEFKGHDIWPVLNEAKNEIYFVSNRDGEYGQVWKKSIDGGDAIALTDFDGDGVQWLNSNPQGTMLVFEQGFKIWILNPDTGELNEVDIDIISDETGNMVERKILKNKVERFSLSPDGKKIAAIVHGELFVIPAEEPVEGIALTNTAVRESFPVWGKDSRMIYFASDQSGNYDIMSVDAVSGDLKQLTSSKENELKPIASPDGKYLAFYRGPDKIVRYNLENNTEKAWVTGIFDDFGLESTISYDWSPDSKWLAFAKYGPTMESDIFAIDLDDNMHNLSRFHGWNYRPRFSNDGKVLYYSFATRYERHSYKIDLQEKPVEFFESSLDSLFTDDTEAKDDDDKSDDESKDGDKTEPVVIDLDRIESRRTRAFDLSASDSYPVLTPDGDKFLFVANVLGKPEIWSVNTEDDPELKQITHGGKAKSNLIVSPDGKTLYYLEGGTIKSCGIDGGKGKTLSFKAPMEIDHMANNRQKFTEAWQMLNEYFYDPTYHGADWKAAKTKYMPLLDNISTDTEFRNMMFELFGELRASHLYIYSRDASTVELDRTGMLGIRFDYQAIDRDGRFKIKKVFTDSPADKAGIKAGMYLRSINGVDLDKDSNIFRHLSGTIDRRLSVGLSDTPGGKITAMNLKPISIIAERRYWYKDWVEERRAMVDEISDGRLAYIHIDEMSKKALDLFTEQLIAIAEPKEGLIIDVRDNGGGHIAVHLLGIIAKAPYILRAPRGIEPTSENKLRSKAYEKPMSLLINNYSGSNSEIFAEGFRTLGLGKIIGTETSGGVIGTSSYYLIDGTRIRRPSTGAFTLDMEDTDIYPRKPDIFVENTPDDFMNGRDPQLKKAVEELLKEL